MLWVRMISSEDTGDEVKTLDERIPYSKQQLANTHTGPGANPSSATFIIEGMNRISELLKKTIVDVGC